MNISDRSHRDSNCSESFCYICVGDGTNFFTYKIIALQRKPSSMSSFLPSSYICQQVWDIDISRDSSASTYKCVGVLKASSTPSSKPFSSPLRAIESPSTRPLDMSTTAITSSITLFQPFRKVILVIHPSEKSYGLVLLVLDAVGSCYKFSKANDLTPSKPFSIDRIYSGCFDFFRSSNLCSAVMSSEHSVEINPFSVSVLFVKSIYRSYTSSGSKDCDSLWFPFLQDKKLILCHSICLLESKQSVLVFTSSFGLLSVMKPIDKRLNVTGRLVTSSDSLSEYLAVSSLCTYIFDAIVATDRSMSTSKKSSSHDSNRDYGLRTTESIESGEDSLVSLLLLKMFFAEIRRRPQLLDLVLDSFELQLKAMAERTNTFYRTFEYAFLISTLFQSDGLIALELLGRLGRKLEPSGVYCMCRRFLKNIY